MSLSSKREFSEIGKSTERKKAALRPANRKTPRQKVTEKVKERKNIFKDKPEQLHTEVELTEKERLSQTKMIIRLFDLWNLSPAQQAICLGLSPHSRTAISSYRRGESCIPVSRDIQDRVGNLFIIHSCLRKLFPENEEIVYTWIHRKNKYFENYTPLEIICRDNYLGIINVRKYLERALII